MVAKQTDGCELMESGALASLKLVGNSACGAIGGSRIFVSACECVDRLMWTFSEPQGSLRGSASSKGLQKTRLNEYSRFADLLVADPLWET